MYIAGTVLPIGRESEDDVLPVPQEHRERLLHVQELPQRYLRHLL
jgi:hypothetical protein